MQVGKEVDIKWTNELRNPVTGECLSHLLPVDQTLHWANPAVSGRRCRGGSTRPDGLPALHACNHTQPSATPCLGIVRAAFGTNPAQTHTCTATEADRHGGYRQ